MNSGLLACFTSIGNFSILTSREQVELILYTKSARSSESEVLESKT